MFKTMKLTIIGGSLMIAVMSPSFADEYIHQVPTEKGYVKYPEHFQSNKTRADVQSEASQAVKSGGSSRFSGNNFPANDNYQKSNRTRQDVINELKNETPAQRKERLELLRG
jgi:predicted SAM-dependent methyltransferase